MSGPFETERQARELPAVQAVYDAMRAQPPSTRGAMARGGHQLLEDACTAAGVDLGAFDHRILLWLAGFEPETCAVIAGLISRAAHRRPPGTVVFPAPDGTCLADLLADAVAYRTERLAGQCADCDTGPAGLCWDHWAALARAEAYQELCRDVLGIGVSS